jgi:hypothetical protein
MPNNRDGKKRFVFKSRIPSEIKRIRGRKDKKLLNDVGKIYGRHIMIALGVEINKASQLGSGIPQTKEFKDSFSFDVTDAGDVVLKSDWPWVKRYLKERGPVRMTWLTKQGGFKGKAVPLSRPDGSVVFRSVPIKISDAWVHPAIEKYTFINRGIERGVKSARREVLRYLQTRKTI